MALRALAAVSVVLLCSGCFGTWRQVKSEHFRVKTDLSSRDAIYTTKEYEKLYRGLQTIFGPAAAPRTVIDVVLFADPNEFSRHTREGFSGFFNGAGTHVSSAPMIVAQNMYIPDGPSDERRTAAHELTHLFMRTAYPGDLPLWVNEGMARYFETLLFDGDELCRGSVDTKLTFALERSKKRPLQEMWQWSRYDASEKETRADYANAWAWVHYLLSEHTAPFEQFRGALARSENPRAAFDAAFAGVSGLEAGFDAYTKRDSFPVFTRPLPPAPAPVLTETLMSLADVQLFKASIALHWENAELAKEELRAARELGANGADLLVLEVAAKVRSSEWSELLGTLKGHPAPETLMPAVLELGREQGVKPAQLMAAVEELEQTRPLDPSTLAWKSDLLTSAGRAEEGLAAARKAAAADPSNDRAGAAELLALARLGKCGEAQEGYRRLVDKMSGHSMGTSSQLRRVVAAINQGCSSR